MIKYHVKLIITCMICILAISITGCNRKSSIQEEVTTMEKDNSVKEITSEKEEVTPAENLADSNSESEKNNYIVEDWMKDISLTSPFKTERNANPLLTQMFCADPTAVEYEGRLYVYATNDNQQYLAKGKEGKNTYEAIKSFVVMSTDDMVNWTYHGVIKVDEISPWIYASWAPSIVSREEEDGLTHFYLYYSNSGCGVGVLTATNPLGPWTDPIGTNIVTWGTPTLGECSAPFDPGVVIDENGTGWLSFGGGDPNKTGDDYYPGNAKIVQLGEDMITLASDIVTIPAPYHFEANELNYINGTWVYTYNTSWKERTKWDFENILKPSACCMSYMTSKTPLDADSWVYQANYIKNPGEQGLGYSNNHTHLHKFNGKYYAFYQSLVLESAMGINGGFRSVGVNEVNVDEENIVIDRVILNKTGVSQIQNVDAFSRQQAVTSFTSAGINYVEDAKQGIVMGDISSGDWICVKGVDFKEGAQKFKAVVKGTGQLLVRIDNKSDNTVAVVKFDSSTWTEVEEDLDVQGVHDVYFVFTGEDSAFSQWNFE